MAWHGVEWGAVEGECMEQTFSQDTRREVILENEAQAV